MIIKILLISFILATAFWFLANRSQAKARAGIKLTIIGFTVSAIVVILFPEASNTVANKLGVGRGADLILYLLAVLYIFFVLNFHFKSNEEQTRTTILARKIAILEAENYEHNKKVISEIHAKNKK